MKKTILAQDFHFPFQDIWLIALFLAFVNRERPDQIILPGDILDCYTISRFDKDPNRKLKLQGEINECFNFLVDLREAAGEDCEIVYLEGNHEQRLRKYLWSKAPELADLECLTIEGLLELDTLDVKYQESIDIGKFHIYHGSLVRQEAGYTAKAEFVKNGCSGMTGHTHRDAKYTRRNRGGHHVWYENFCMCDLDAEYIDGIANWTQGWSVMTTVGSRQYVEQIPVINHRYIWKGEEYK
jgi:predicted phosphodiesterase